jgi:hypothetical protein
VSYEFGDLPTSIQTADCGKATIGKVKAEDAIKQYTCPLCTQSIKKGVAHVIAVPVTRPDKRRHCHGECIETHLEFRLTVKLHPNEAEAMQYPRSSHG